MLGHLDWSCETPDCALFRKDTHLDKPFKLIDKDKNEYAFHPEDKEFKAQLKYIRSWLKDQ